MSYSSEVLADSPVGYWRLGDVPAMVDSSGNGRNGVYIGSAPSATGLVHSDTDTARSFSGGSRGTVADAAWMDAASFTILATITPTVVTGTQTIVARYDGFVSGVFNNSSFSLRLNGNKLECHIFIGNTAGAATTTATLSAGTTYDVAATYDGTTVKVYLNGGSSVSATRSGMNNASMPLTVGSTNSPSTESFGGVIDDVAYIGSALSATDIATLSNTRTSGSGYAAAIAAFSPLAYYRLGEGTSSTTTMADSSGNAHDGTYSGSYMPGDPSLLPSTTDKAVTFTPNAAGTVTSGTWMDSPSFTIEAWIKPSTVSGTRVIASRQESVSPRIWTLRLEGTALKFYWWNSGDTLQGPLTASTTFAAGTVYHVAAVFTLSGSVTLYVNGSSVGSTSTGSSLEAGVTNLRVAASGFGEQYGGVIDEVAYYTTALTGTRIAAHYTAGTSTSTPASGAASLSLSAAGGVAAAAAGSALLSLSASSGAAAAASGAASLSLSAAGSTVAPTPASGSASLTLSATGAASASPGGSAALDLLAAGAAIAVLPASGSASLSLSASGSAVMSAGGSAMLVLTAGGVAVALYETDTSNALDGLDLLLTATVIFAVPATAPPSSLGVKYDVAMPYPTPVMVGGRPT